MMTPEPRGSDADLPRLPAAVLRRLLPRAEREEVLEELAAEYAARERTDGRAAASAWLWRQVLGSAPSLAGWGWWRGWSGFEPRANRWQPGGTMLEEGARDVKFALRRLRRRPTYAVLTVMTLALGVAGTAAVFGVAKQMLLEPLPVRAEEEVVMFWFQGAWSEAGFAHVRPEMEAFHSVAAFRSADATLQVADAPARLVTAVSATAELFQVLGVGPVIGQGFRPGDDRMGAEPVVVLSHSLWQELGASPTIVGERIELSGQTRTVTGVMPAGFWFPEPTVRAWLVEEVDPQNEAGNYALVGRMGRGMTVETMGPQLERITRSLGERFEYPEAWDLTANPELTPLRDHVVGPVRPAVLAVLGAMAVILLIACVNVAALMLGQVDGRGTELAVRNALGAGRQRLLRSLVVESLVIGALAGVAGAGLAVLGFRFLTSALPLGALAETARVDWSLFAATMLFALVAATAIALVPGISVARGDLQPRLTRSRTAGIGGRGGRLEGALVVAQVALVLLLSAGAALLMRSVANLRAIDPGVEVEGIAVVDVVMPVTTEASRRPQVVRDLVSAVAELPGVEAAGATQRLPLRGSSDNWGVDVEGRPDLESTATAFRVVTADYFRTMGIPLRSGRGLLETDALADAEEGAVVVNEAFAARYFPGEDPIGRRIGFMDRWDRVVGVVGNVAEAGLSVEPVPTRYMLYEQVPWLLSGQTLVLRTRDGTDPAAMLDRARRAIQAVQPGIAVRELTTMQNVFGRSLGPAPQVMALLTLLSGLAMVLGLIGVYGVVSHLVMRRRRDWGIRIALGLVPPRVVRQIVGQGGLLVGMGIVLGIAGFLALSRTLGSFLYEVGAADPLALVSTTAVLLLAGLLVALIPAWRASRINPALVLRDQ